MTRRSILIIGVAVVVAAAVVLAIVTLQDRDNVGSSAGDPTGEEAASAAADELFELTGRLDLGDLEDTSFVSILVPNVEGQPTSYMVDASRSEAKALIDAVRRSDTLDADDPATARATSTTQQSASSGQTLPPTVTFVLLSRHTVTFALDLETGLLYRDGQAYRPKGDLGDLVSQATGSRP